MRNKDIALESALRVLQEFQAQGAKEVFSVYCCGRMYIGRGPALICRTCSQKPDNKTILTAEDFKSVLL